MITYPFSFITTDPNAANFISAVIAAGGTLTGSERVAINQFYSSLKSDGIYNKLYFMHLFVGGTANSNKLDALNPGGTYDLGFNGTWTHSTGGSYSPQTAHPSYPNYADTHYDISTNNSTTTVATSWSFGTMMSNVQTTAAPYGYSGAGPSPYYMVIGHAGSNSTDNFFPDEAVIQGTGYTRPEGFINAVFRWGANNWQSGVRQYGTPAGSGMVYGGSRTSAYTQPASVTNIYYNAISGAGFPTGGNYLFGWAAQYLTQNQMDQFLIRINDLQTAFGRNILT